MSRIGYRIIQENVVRVRAPNYTVPVKLVEVPIPYGAVKELFCCPKCDRRCMWVYSLHGEWACRTCHKLAYRSENSDKAQRLWLQQQKGKPIERRMRRLANS